MAQEADVALFVEQARMLLFVSSPVLGSLSNITFCNNLSVNCYTYIITLSIDFLLVPFACWLESAWVICFGWNNAINRTVVL